MARVPNENLLYNGVIQHRRHSPRGHAFSYKLFMPYFNVETLENTARRIWCLSLERFNLATFRRKDHFGPTDEALAETVRRTIAEQGGGRPEGDIMLLAHLAYCGYALNPISLFFCHSKASESSPAELTHIVAEVHNTPWGEHCSYVLPITGDAMTTQTFSSNKAMHVSPFMPMDMEYRWRIRKTSDRLIVHIENWREELKVFDATLTLTPKPLTASRLSLQLMRMPLVTVKVAVGIYWQALRLWLKKTPYVAHPKRSENR